MPVKTETPNYWRTVVADGQTNARRLLRQAKRKGWPVEAVGEGMHYCIVRVPRDSTHVLEKAGATL